MGLMRPRNLVLDVYTPTHHISGSLSTREGRLSDTLNYELPHFVVLSDVSSRRLEKPEESPTRGSSMHLNTMAIAFAVPKSPEPDLEERRQSRMFEYVEKERHRAVVKVPPFRCEGYVHLPKGNDVQRAMWNLTPAFIPLSDVRITLSEHPELVWRSEIVILNRRKAQITLANEEDAPD